MYVEMGVFGEAGAASRLSLPLELEVVLTVVEGVDGLL